MATELKPEEYEELIKKIREGIQEKYGVKVYTFAKDAKMRKKAGLAEYSANSIAVALSGTTSTSFKIIAQLSKHLGLGTLTKESKTINKFFLQ